MIASSAFCQVLVDTPESVPARYTLARWRFSCGWGTDSFRALSSNMASVRFLVPILPAYGFRYLRCKTSATLAAGADVRTFHKIRLLSEAYETECGHGCISYMCEMKWW
jgi:hypothetical protein